MDCFYVTVVNIIPVIITAIIISLFLMLLTFILVLFFILYYIFLYTEYFSILKTWHGRAFFWTMFCLIYSSDDLLLKWHYYYILLLTIIIFILQVFFNSDFIYFWFICIFRCNLKFCFILMRQKTKINIFDFK